MKRYIIALLVLAALAGCEKEKALTPSEVRNWLEITDPGSGGDAVDKKIYDIYKTYGISVFLTDTIGREDRGWRNAKGEVEYYYEMVDLNYDLTALPPGTDGKVGWTRIEHWLPAQKARVLPLLELFEQKMIPAVGGASALPHIVMITDGLTMGSGTQAVIRGSSYMALSTNMFEASRGDLIWAFAATANPELADAESPIFADYFEAAREAFSDHEADIWAPRAELTGGGYYATYFPDWIKDVRSVMWLDFTAERDRLQGLIDDGDTSAATAALLADAELQLTRLKFPYSGAFDYPNAQFVYDNEAAIREELEQLRPENFGMMVYDQMPNQGSIQYYRYYYLLPKANDLSWFVGQMLTYDDSELTALYGRFPVMMQRFNLLKTALIEAGIDLDSLRG